MGKTDRTKGCVLELSARPSSGRSELRRRKDGSLLAHLKSAPEGGKANAELIKLVGRALGIPKTDLRLTLGKTGRKKRLKIEGVDRKTLQEIIARSVPQA